MSAVEYTSYDSVCRGCLGKKGEMRPLFGTCLDAMLMNVAEIEVHKGDGYPELMCVQCVLQVSRAFTFKKQCQRSDNMLRKFKENKKTEESITETVTQSESTIIEDPDALLNSKKKIARRYFIIQPQAAEMKQSHTEEQSQPIQELQQSNDFQQIIEPISIISDTKHNILDYNMQGNVQGSVEVEFKDPSNGEKRYLIVQRLPMMKNEYGGDTAECNDQDIQIVEECDGLQLIGGFHENQIIICEDELLKDNDADDDGGQNKTINLHGISFTNEDMGALPLSTELITEHFDVYSNDEVSNNDHDSMMVAINNHANDIFSSDIENEELRSMCIECNLDFDSLEDLKLHQEQVHSVEIDKQNQEEQFTEQISDLDGNKFKCQYKCNVCDKIFAESKILRRHLKIHSLNKPHVCGICYMSFAESSNLTKHTKKHTGELRNVIGKPNLCSFCGKRFKWASSLSKHMKHHTRHKILNCPHCPKYYVEARSLNIHIRSHTGEKPFVCTVCNKGFTQLGNLEKHTRVHTGEKPFICPVCGKGFSQSGYVAIHVRTHTGERPYICTECGKGFAGSNTLAIHKRTHTGERPYPCNTCDKTFARQETAIIHQRTHTGEKPHICHICDRGFTSSGHLSGHMRSHTGVKPYECEVCLKRFAGSSSLKCHRLKSHKDYETAENATDVAIEGEDEEKLDTGISVLEIVNITEINTPEENSTKIMYAENN